MKHMKTINYYGFEISQKDNSHCATIRRDGEVFKMIAGDIDADGSNNAIQKAIDYIDAL
jgi:hypothetical protein